MEKAVSSSYIGSHDYAIIRTIQETCKNQASEICPYFLCPKIGIIFKTKRNEGINTVTIFKEISLSNGQTLKNVGYAGSKDEFDTARKTTFEIELERKNEMTTDRIYHIYDEI